MKKLRIALDCDDVLYDCNGYALEKLKKEEGYNYCLRDITLWGKLGTPLDERLKYFDDPVFYEKMPLMDGAQEFVHRLSEMAEVFIASSIPDSCMCIRSQKLLHDFKELKSKNIFIGLNKALLQVDVLLDDGLHHICSSIVDYPVLYRRPWNSEASGVLSVNNYNEFLCLIEKILDTRDFL